MLRGGTCALEYALNGFDPIKEIRNGVYLTGFFSNIPSFGASYDFADIKEACIDVNAGR